MEDKDVAGIRISPANITFYDTTADSVEQLNVTVSNISKSSKSIRYYAPKTKVSIVTLNSRQSKLLSILSCLILHVFTVVLAMSEHLLNSN